MNTYKEKYIHIKKQNGCFHVRVVVPGHPKDLQRKESGIHNLGQAKSIARSMRDELLTRRDKLAGGIITFANAKEQYLRHCGSTFKPSGFYSLKTCLEAHTSHWNSKLVTDIKSSEVWDLDSNMISSLKPSTVDRNIRHIRGLFCHMMKIGILDRNPTDNVKFSKVSYARKLTAMTRPEIDLLLQHTQKTNHPLHPIFYVAYQTGARSGEQKELRIRDINFDDGTLTISRSYCTKSKAVVTTKSGRARTLPLNESILSFLRDLTAGKNPDDFVLPRLRPFIKGETSKILRSIQSELGIQQTNFHSLRASFITHLLIRKVPVTSVQEMAGHCDLKTTQAYVRMVAADLKGATDSIALHLHADPVRSGIMPIAPVGSAHEFISALSSL